MRDIDEIIVHCTATPEGREVSAEEIDDWHRARGWSGIGYHRVVHLDGSVSDGRPIGDVGAHVAGHNTGTIGLVYVGGVAKDGVTPKDTRTADQKEALVDEIRRLRERFDITTISGHRDYAAKACPSFDATKEYAPLSRDLRKTPPTDKILKRGDRGADVMEWRSKLKAWREMVDHRWPMPPGDVFDHTTELATIHFQKERGIVADGKVGPQTRREMNLALDDATPYQAHPLGVGPALDDGVDPESVDSETVAEAVKLINRGVSLLEGRGEKKD